ncbi:hypothetical protein PLESTB_000360700 [Pleodorina starrii]|uniref:ATP-dependent RNA helicase n=1 Tax=Pleodorina starrii TaxID=330485 RepID=A0A9W6BDR0_9CHLO|nr:hypothetical protein PLESTM_000034500 [Pleodorina starrii]GLC50267.1 hypothetical protein PLESTB_000360700 [Pleodorina starrii]GLC64349.1 hypothetical protein PLESTF_000151900 [Pleodorina starrii]
MTAPQSGGAPPGGPKGPSAPQGGQAPAATGPVLPWMRVPLTVQAGSGVPVGKVLGLDARLASELRTGSGFSELFPVQAAVWQHSAGGLSAANDLCVAAPTGSGKTLAYALPVVNALAALLPGSAAGVGRLRVLVVLPTRDLAAQVYDVFRPLCEAVQLRVALAAARSSEAAEAAQLVGGASSCGGGGGRGGGGDGADVVVATPGRLMAHLSGTPGFSLRHLRFLVVDETDRLLRQSYQEWLPRVLAQIEPGQHQQQHQQLLLRGGGGGGGGSMGLGAAEGEHFASRWPGGSSGTVLPFAQPRVVKIVVSATLTRDPAKLQRLALYHPRFVATAAAAGMGGAGAGAGGRYSLPRSLSEYRLLCSAARKPLALLALLHDWAGQSSIVFTSSLEMTHKLFLMLRAVSDLPDEVVEYSSMVPTKERAAALERFRSGAAKVLVASDAMTRGMDVEHVANVINYDAPVYAKTYVHRAGRTARAGKCGRVVTLLRDEDMRHFKAMLRKADNNFLRDLKLPPERLEGLRPALAGALQQLEELLAAERAADKQMTQQQQQQQQQRKGSKHQQETNQKQTQQPSAGKGQGQRQGKEREEELQEGEEEEAGLEAGAAVGKVGGKRRRRAAAEKEEEGAADGDGEGEGGAGAGAGAAPKRARGVAPSPASGDAPSRPDTAGKRRKK